MLQFHHALKILTDKCIGCIHCMEVCPTDAIRLKAGKANVNGNRCVDCGECMRACPVSAIVVEQDDFDKIYNYKCRIALVPAVLFGQFSSDIKEEQIFSALEDMGFTYVYEVEYVVDILSKKYDEELEKTDKKPLISSFCPTVIRLIQVKYPSLTGNIALLKNPADLAALYCKKYFIDNGFSEDEIGIFYITPCAAKIAAIKTVDENKKSVVNGVINMNFIYNKIYKIIQQGKSKPIDKNIKNISQKGILWSLTNGECDKKQRCLAIDGIHNVIEFLEKLENEEINDVDFLELRSCDQSCAGGVLSPRNRFLTVETLKNRIKNKKDLLTIELDNDLKKYENFINDVIKVDKIETALPLVLDSDISIAMKKMEIVDYILSVLPKIDCRVCGTSGCQALAEDIAMDKGDINQCIFIQKRYELKQISSLQNSIDILKKIWGNDKL